MKPKRKPKPADKRKPAHALREPPAKGSFERWESELTEPERRVDLIVQRMQQGAWLSGVSERALAKEWNVSPVTVRHAAVEAGRVIRRALRETPEAKAEARAAIMQTFEVIRAKAMGKGDPSSLRVALDATRALGFYMGVEPARQLEVGKMDDPFDGWTTEEKAAFARDGSRPRRALREVQALGVAAALTDGNVPDDDGGDSVH